MVTFEQLGLSNDLLKGLSELGFDRPSEIQEQAIPQLIEGYQDFIGLAQTGTGKTAAFGLPLLELVDSASQNTQALILAPTRELGQQIAQQLELYGKYMDRINMVAVYGGAPITAQIKALRRSPHVIIATPGRLIDLLKRKAINLSALQYLILDEADEMLNMGFQDELEEILRFTPEEKITWLFSATMADEIKGMVDRYMVNPVVVQVNKKNEVNTNILHQYSVVRNSDKTEALMRFIDRQPTLRGVVFCRTKRETQALAEELLKRNYKADALHGDLSQAQRDRVMRRFKAHELQVLIATDVAARGIDVNDLTHVFHFSLPDDNAYYTHRSGRTARAGKTGTSIAFIHFREKSKVIRLEKQLGIAFEPVKIPMPEDIAEQRVESWVLDVLAKQPKKSVPSELLEQANLMFGNLTKEELVAKLMAFELDKMNLGDTRDLNDYPPKRDGRSGKPYQKSNSRGGNNYGPRKPSYNKPNNKKKYQKR